MSDGAWSGPIVLTLWTTAGVVVFLGAHVALGYQRSAEDAPTRRSKSMQFAAGAAALGTALWAAMVLAISTQDPAFPMGYRALGLAAAWGLAVAAAGLAALLLALRARAPVVLPAVAALALGLAAVQAQALLLRALGLQPGAAPAPEAQGVATLMAAAGLFAAFWIVFAGPGREGKRRRVWRWGGALAAAFGTVVAQALMIVATPVETQVGSLYARQVPTAAAALAAGVGVPLLLLVALGDLHLRRIRVTPKAAPPPRSRGRRLRRLQ